MVYQNWIRNFLRSIDYPVRLPSKLYEDIQETIKRVLSDRITPQARPINILIIKLLEIHLLYTFYMVDTRSNIQLADINSKTCGVKGLIDIIDRAIGFRFYPPPVSEHYKLLRLNRFYGSTHHQISLHDKCIKVYQNRVS